MKTKLQPQLLAVIVFIYLTSSFTALLLLFDQSKPKYFELLFLLPTMFLVCSIIFLRVYKYMFKGVGIFIFLMLLYFRYTIIPLIMYFGKYAVYLSNIDVYDATVEAIIVMIWEVFILFTMLFVYGDKYYTTKPKITPVNLEPRNFRNNKYFVSRLNFVSTLIILGIISSFLLYPKIQYYYSSYFFTSETAINFWNTNANEILNETPSIVRAIVIFWVDSIKYFITIYFILLLYKKHVKFGYKYEFKFLIVSFIIVFLNFIFMTPNMAINVYITVALLFLLRKLYRNQGEKVLKMSLFAIILTSIYILITKGLLGGYSSTGGSLSYLSSLFQSYFSGPINVSTAVHTTHIIDYSRFEIFIADILKKTPIIQYFFQTIPTPTSPILFNNTMYGFEGRKDQIIPLIGQGYLYFGGFLAPLLSIIMLHILMFFDNKSRDKHDNVFYVIYVFGAVMTAFTINAYNLDIFIQLMIQYLLPLYILIKINCRVSSKKLVS